MSGLTHNGRAVKHLRALGYYADTVERQLGKFKSDWLGFTDVIGMPGPGLPQVERLIAVQVTPADRLSDHRKKLNADGLRERVAHATRYVDVELWSIWKVRKGRRVEWRLRRFAVYPTVEGELRFVQPRADRQL